MPDHVEEAYLAGLAAWRALTAEYRAAAAREPELAAELAEAQARHEARPRRTYHATEDDKQAERAVRQAEEALTNHRNRCDTLGRQVARRRDLMLRLDPARTPAHEL